MNCSEDTLRVWGGEDNSSHMNQGEYIAPYPKIIIDESMAIFRIEKDPTRLIEREIMYFNSKNQNKNQNLCESNPSN